MIATDLSVGHPRINWDRIENFVGYGNRAAPVVFIGMEEGLKEEDGLLGDLLVRSRWPDRVMDLEKAHEGIAGTELSFDPERAPKQPTWRVMSDLMLRRGGNSAPTRVDRKRYRTLRLGRAGGDTLLAELLPYPNKKYDKSETWLYRQFGQYNDRHEYEKALLGPRKQLLREALAWHPRKLVVCYGKHHWEHFQGLFDGVRWRDIGPKFRVGEGGVSRVILTTHFSDRGLNTDVQLAELAATALG